MHAGEKKKQWDSSRFRREYMTYWQRSHPVMFPHVQTDHWSKMKTMVPVYLASVPSALLKGRDYDSHEGALPHMTPTSLLPSLTQDEASGVSQNTPIISPQNMPQYRNAFNDRARRDFCYWLVEKKTSTCKGYSFGAYKTCLGLPKV